jgi:hypothetical protein
MHFHGDNRYTFFSVRVAQIGNISMSDLDYGLYSVKSFEHREVAMQSLIQPCKFTISVNILNKKNLFRSLQRRNFMPSAQSSLQEESDDVGSEFFSEQQDISITEHQSLDSQWDELYVKDKKLPLKLLAGLSKPAKTVWEEVISLAIKSAPALLNQYLRPDIILNHKGEEVEISSIYNTSVKHDFEKIKLQMDIIDDVFRDIRFLASTVLAIYEEPHLTEYQSEIFTSDFAFDNKIITALETGSSIQKAIAGIMGHSNMERIKPLPIGFDIGEIGLNSPMKLNVFNIFYQHSNDYDAKEQIKLAKATLNQSRQTKYIAIVSLVIALISPSQGAPNSIEPSQELKDYYVNDLHNAARAEDPKLAQQMMAELGYYKGNIDGLWEVKSVKAASQLCSDMKVVCRDYHSQIFIIHLAKLMTAASKG